MEFPHLGKHCSEKSCNQLDFLPMQCDACEQTFCKAHIRYELHKCQSSYKKDIQVPVCPLCSQPVPWKRGEAPDLAVSDHIDRDCQSDPAMQKRKVFGNHCTLKGCKKKEVIPVVCDQCKMNFCLRHRHAIDHNCKGNNPADRAREAALARAASGSGIFTKQRGSSRPQNTSYNASASTARTANVPRAFAVATVQGNLSEDEALARAMQASLQDQTSLTAHQQEEVDRMLALALQRGEQASIPTANATPSSSSNSCSLS
uniref:EOG090X0APF n=1 Tax=Daphnia lumholtzi TaxID=42856 RepID=A0A4Y7MEE2_9CRUS|nr:EOG090X0APF [Daphnia lumholtzi]SVE77774.1 EOG090X0APF [Daphnia lumholtzi]SVE78402.1 EOG090X0APF [Daphnia lumholtzi]